MMHDEWFNEPKFEDKKTGEKRMKIIQFIIRFISVIGLLWMVYLGSREVLVFCLFLIFMGFEVISYLSDKFLDIFKETLK